MTRVSLHDDWNIELQSSLVIGNLCALKITFLKNAKKITIYRAMWGISGDVMIYKNDICDRLCESPLCLRILHIFAKKAVKLQ